MKTFIDTTFEYCEIFNIIHFCSLSLYSINIAPATIIIAKLSEIDIVSVIPNILRSNIIKFIFPP